jgi:hypothetical protein
VKVDLMMRVVIHACVTQENVCDKGKLEKTTSRIGFYMYFCEENRYMCE